MIQHSLLYHQHTCGITPINGRTIIRKKQADSKIGLIHVPEAYRGKAQTDWQAEVIAVAAEGGWRGGVVNVAFQQSHGHWEEKHPADLTEKERKDKKIWRIQPYYVEKPVLPPGTKIICCWLSGQPFISVNGYDYFLTDGEHVYKALVRPTPVTSN